MTNESTTAHRVMRRTSIDQQEERVWIAFYQCVGRNPALAVEVMAQLDADPALKQGHLGLYLSCKQSVRLHKERQARNRRIAQLTREILHGLTVRPLFAMKSALQRAVDLIIECATTQASSGRSPGLSSPRTAEPRTKPADRPIHRLARSPASQDRPARRELVPPGADAERTAEAVPDTTATPVQFGQR